MVHRNNRVNVMESTLDTYKKSLDQMIKFYNLVFAYNSLQSIITDLKYTKIP